MKPQLTIGMACHDDYDGVYFTLQSLRLYHDTSRFELVVVDNNPGSPHGQMLSNLIRTWMYGPVRYIPYTEKGGTAAPRNQVFAQASSEYVLCIDSHVMLKPGAIDALLSHYRGNPDTRDLLSGPMLYDDLAQCSTHFSDVWRGEMWGTWGVAYLAPSGAFVEFREVDGKAGMFGLMNQRHLGTLATDWPGHESKLAAMGYVRATDLAHAFEIPAMGLGLFSCRKDAWLKFHDEFRGFGGEEFYIHEKFRQAGHKCLCIPQLKWAHRFGRPAGVKYPLRRYDKVKNYVLGHTELGLSLDRVYEHFVASGLFSEGEWKRVLAGEPEVSTCVPCAANSLKSLEEWYTRAAETAGDINEHVPKLKELASQCGSVVEFGMRRGVSSVALLAGQPKQFTSYDVNYAGEVALLDKFKGQTDFNFKQGSSLEVEIDGCDMLFIDTKHTAEQLRQELARHAGKVKRWIVLHDTVTFGETGEDGGQGLLFAVREFMQANPQWTVKAHYRNNNGLLVLTCDPEEKKPLPSLWKQAGNFTKALAAHVADGATKVSNAEYETRLSLCVVCPSRNNEKCGECGCILAEKAAWRSADCPLGVWPK